MERDPNTLSPKMLQGFVEPKASGEGKLSAVHPSPCSDGIPQSLPSRTSSEHSVQSLGSLMRSDEATSVRFPQILALLTLLSGRSCHENCVGGFSGLCGANGSGMRFQHRKRPLLRQYTKITLETLNVFVRYLKKHVAVRRCSQNGLARISARHFGSSGSPKQLPPFAFGGGLKGKSWTLGFSFSCQAFLRHPLSPASRCPWFQAKASRVPHRRTLGHQR